MTNVITHKKNSTAGQIPPANLISQGEIAINLADGKLFTKNNNNQIINLPVTSISGAVIGPSGINMLSNTNNSVFINVSGNNGQLINLTNTSINPLKVRNSGGALVPVSLSGHNHSWPDISNFSDGIDSFLTTELSGINGIGFLYDDSGDILSLGLTNEIQLSGINGINLTSDIDNSVLYLSADNSVVRTTGNQTINGNKTFNNNVVVGEGGFLAAMGTILAGKQEEGPGYNFVADGGNIQTKLAFTNSPASHFAIFTDNPLETSRHLRTRTASEVKGDIGLGNVQNLALSGITFTAGNGLTGGGTLSNNRTFNVGGGDGIVIGATGVSVNTSVVRTTGNQTISGIKTFSNTPIFSSGIQLSSVQNQGSASLNYATTNLNNVSVLFTSPSDGDLVVAYTNHPNTILQFGTAQQIKESLNVVSTGSIGGGSSSAVLQIINFPISGCINFNTSVNIIEASSQNVATWNIRGLFSTYNNSSGILIGSPIIESWMNNSYVDTKVFAATSGYNLLIRATGLPSPTMIYKSFTSYMS